MKNLRGNFLIQRGRYTAAAPVRGTGSPANLVRNVRAITVICKKASVLFKRVLAPLVIGFDQSVTIQMSLRLTATIATFLVCQRCEVGGISLFGLV
ncbi:MAG: hypothetical protein WCC57_12830 [Paracoccaceae bacterium]